MAKQLIDFTRRRFFEGFDDEGCKVSPRVATDGKRVIVIYERLLFVGSDVINGIYQTESMDGGETFSEPERVKAFEGYTENGLRYAYSVGMRYNKAHNMWYSMGFRTAFQGSEHYLDENGKPLHQLVFRKYDPDAHSFGETVEIGTPDGYDMVCPGSPCELPSGDFLNPFYGYRKGEDRMVCFVAKYRMTEGGPVLDRVGPALDDDGFDYSPYDFSPEKDLFGIRGRGIYEPMIIENNGRYYMTIRNDQVGLFAVSDDGFTYTDLKPWVWDDGSVLQNYNTQQHWVKLGNTLFLTYTRITPHNHHVFRNRAPIFMAQFDEEKQCLLRDSEVILVPELGARLGNYNTIQADDKTAMLVVCEWMQGPKGPRGCASYGSNNALWVSKIFLKE